MKTYTTKGKRAFTARLIGIRGEIKMTLDEVKKKIIERKPRMVLQQNAKDEDSTRSYENYKLGLGGKEKIV